MATKSPKTVKPAKGRLIALEGSGGRAMAVAARQFERRLRSDKVRVATSVWDASDLFFQISQGSRGLSAPPPQTLILLYATDLAFRLRWQIRPALEEGITVIAAPYIETAIGFGIGAKLPGPWVRRLFAFAPKPDETHRVPEARLPADRRPTPADSFLEFCLTHLRTGPASWNTEEIRSGLTGHLGRMESRGKARVVSAK
jgi:hypothetical protein